MQPLAILRRAPLRLSPWKRWHEERKLLQAQLAQVTADHARLRALLAERLEQEKRNVAPSGG
jgi:hypothetical protein